MTRTTLLLILAAISLACILALASCHTVPETERDVIRAWGAPTVIPDSGWHIDQYRDADGWTDDFGIYEKNGTCFLPFVAVTSSG